MKQTISFVSSKLFLCLFVVFGLIMCNEAFAAKAPFSVDLYIGSSCPLCGPVLSATSVSAQKLGTAFRVIVDGMPPNGLGYPTAVLKEGEKIIDTATNNALKTNELIDKAIKTREKSKLIQDRCYLIAPGMSLENGKMYGQKFVRAKNDNHRFMPEVIADPLCLLRAKPEIITCVITPRYGCTGLNDFVDDDMLCHWAVDYENNTAIMGSDRGKGDDGTESLTNFQIREKQKEKKLAGFDMYAVTMDEDFGHLGESAKDGLHTKEGARCLRKSNETCAREAAEDNVKASGGQAIPSMGKGKAPTEAQHRQYWLDTNATYFTIPPPGNEEIDIRPGDCPVSLDKSNPTCQSNGAASKGGGIVQNADLIVNTNGSSCTYDKSKAKNTKKPNDGKPFDWSKGNGNSGNGGSGSGGDILKQLMQALQQGAGNGSGNSNNSNSSATPTPTATPYVCAASSTDEKVCGVNGVTYISRCVAENENKVSVRHVGICTSNDAVSVSSDSTTTTLRSLLDQLAHSGMPDEMLDTVTQAIIKLIQDISRRRSVT